MAAVTSALSHETLTKLQHTAIHYTLPSVPGMYSMYKVLKACIGNIQIVHNTMHAIKLMYCGAKCDWTHNSRTHTQHSKHMECQLHMPRLWHGWLTVSAATHDD